MHTIWVLLLLHASSVCLVVILALCACPVCHNNSHLYAPLVLCSFPKQHARMDGSPMRALCIQKRPHLHACTPKLPRTPNTCPVCAACSLHHMVLGRTA